MGIRRETANGMANVQESKGLVFFGDVSVALVGDQIKVHIPDSSMEADTRQAMALVSSVGHAGFRFAHCECGADLLTVI